MSSTITTKQNTIDVMTTAARMYGRRSSRTRLEGYAVISKLLDGVKFNNEESVKSTFKNVANVLKSNGFEVEKWYAPLFYFEAQARAAGFEPIEWVKEELSAELRRHLSRSPKQNSLRRHLSRSPKQNSLRRHLSRNLNPNNPRKRPSRSPRQNSLRKQKMYHLSIT